MELVVEEYATFKEAAEWASKYLNKEVSPSNISYLVQYGRLEKNYNTEDQPRVSLKGLKEYYDSVVINKQEVWKKRLGKDINWALSFQQLREKDTTKHVHRLHPYKGKFIPQLVEYFLNQDLNHLKEEVYFKQGDTVLDPFAGSGTTLVQALELGINSIGIDISEFNCLISKVKTKKFDMDTLQKCLIDALENATEFSKVNFEGENKIALKLKQIIAEFNQEHFPSPAYKLKINRGELNESEYAQQKVSSFFKTNKDVLTNVKRGQLTLAANRSWGFLDIWLSKRTKQEASNYLQFIERLGDSDVKDIMRVILSRSIRSCRSTTHSDLATLRKPQCEPYYCTKHLKICSPIASIIQHLKKNTLDTLKRIEQFSDVRKDSYAEVINADSRTVDIFEEIKKANIGFYDIIKTKKIDGIFTSPPYLGQIDYHDQHAYAYEIFNIKRKDELEIGPLSKGKGRRAQEAYIDGISDVLSNTIRFLKKGANIFIVANDIFNLYPLIAQKAGLQIVNEFKRPVLNRTERDKQPYAETIFHMKPA